MYTIINPVECRKHSIQIEMDQSEYSTVPQVRVYFDGEHDPMNCAYIRLDKDGYVPGMLSRILNDKQVKEFIEIMSSNWTRHISISRYDKSKNHPASTYEAAVDTWIETFGETVDFKYDSEGFLIMPEYNYI